MDAYWQDAMAATSVNAVCALAGVSKPSLSRDLGREDGLTAAVLGRCAQTVLGPVEALLSSPASGVAELDDLIRLASEDQRMEVCPFVKTRAMRSRFGAQTPLNIAAIEAHILARDPQFFNDGAASGKWRGGVAAGLAAGDVLEQLALTVSQRAAGKSPESVRELLALALSVRR